MGKCSKELPEPPKAKAQILTAKVTICDVEPVRDVIALFVKMIDDERLDKTVRDEYMIKAMRLIKVMHKAASSKG